MPWKASEEERGLTAMAAGVPSAETRRDEKRGRARSGADALSSVPPAAAGLQGEGEGEGEQDGGDGWIYAAGWLAPGAWLLALLIDPPLQAGRQD